MTVHFEDLAPGDVFEYGTREVTEAEVVEFAERYDPQWFHTDPERARDSVHGGLIASGWHTAAMAMSLLVEGHYRDAATLGAVGVDELRWPAPTRPGDELSVRMEITETRPSESRDDRGLVRSDVTVADQSGETKATLSPLVLYARRE
ncbi:MAG: MaoC family dehydratase [Halobacteriaceae archaeon]